ncbi:MAG: metalloregulator ArsR/SmtB family transcription factor, partial [Reichenbachiella sp.]|uniref:ArsR/SmtB family transcription factor n=2 Tax=Reichenbachiella sp. TaxID=2184521 RepID=UPI00329781B4
RLVTFILVTERLLKIMRRDVFQAIADPVRRDIIEMLAEEALTVNTVAEKFDVSRPAISKHLKILKECGIITIDKQGRERLCQIKPANLIPAFMWIEQYRKLWEDRLDSFEDYLIKLQSKDKKDE